MQRALKVVIVAMAITSCAWSQASTGTVGGTARDQSGAVIANTQVALTNTATDVNSTTRTNESGLYLFPGVNPGGYRLVIEVPGMQKYEVAFTVLVAQSVVIDPVLGVAQSATTVQVADVTPVVDVDNPTLHNEMDHARIEQLPVNQRMLMNLTQIVPGEEGSKGSRSFGLPAQAQEWIVDGAVVTDRRYSMSLFSQSPGLGAVDEFTLDTGAVSARYSRPSNVIVSTKSGTNQLHGTAYETLLNNDIALARSRTDFYTKTPQLVRNEFGFNVGGPVAIPKLYDGRNRTFWFFNWEGLKSRSATSTGYNVPTAAMRNGDFSGLTDAQGRLQVLYDPWTTGPAPTYQRIPFPNNQIPMNRQSPLAKYLFGITPLPSNNANPLVAVNYFGLTKPGDSNTWSLSTRLDHQFSERDHVYVRLGYMNDPHVQSNTTGSTGPMFLNQVAGWKFVLNQEESAATSWVHIISPSLFNELTAAVRYRRGGGSTGTSTSLSTNWFTQLGMPNPLGVNDWPQFTSTGLGNYNLTAPGTDRGNETYYTLDDNVTKIHGRHELLFGGHARKDFIDTLPNTAGRSSFTFDTLATALYDPASSPSNPVAVPQTGQNIANLFLGVSTYQESLVRSWYYMRSGEGALYIQDNFKVTPRLTLNLGIRWEAWLPLSEKNDTITGFDQANHAIVLGTSMNTLYGLGLTEPSVVSTYQGLGLKFESAQTAGLPNNLIYGQYKNFGPRLGFAYRAIGGAKPLVVRGGYSLSYFNMDYSWVSNLSGDAPFSATFSNNPNNAALSPDGVPNYLLRSVPTYVDGVNSTTALGLNQPQGITRGSASVTYFDPNLPTARLHSWNLTLEKELMPSTAARVRYVGSHAADLPELYSYNQATPSYIWYATTGQPLPTGDYANVAIRPYDQQVLGTVQQYRNTGYTNNESMAFELERRYNKGYAFQLSYVVTNALGTGSGVSTVPGVNQFMPGAVPTDYDQLNRFLNYGRDTSIPKHRVRWNFLIDLPVGRGKLLGRNMGKALDMVAGGWQLAGIGSLWSNYFSLPTSNWNFTGVPVQIYGYKYPIQNCTSGSCIPGYLYWNGYIPADLINSHDAHGNPNGYEGVPANYQPAVTPLIPWGATALPANAPAGTNVSQYWDTSTVWVPLKNGTVQRLTYNNGLNPWRNQYMPGVRQWSQDASLFKVIPIHESVRMRFAADFFNVFNHPDNPNTIGGDGFLNTQASGISPRVLQLSLRLDW
jgi:hypothetical protein